MLEVLEQIVPRVLGLEVPEVLEQEVTEVITLGVPGVLGIEVPEVLKQDISRLLGLGVLERVVEHFDCPMLGASEIHGSSVEFCCLLAFDEEISSFSLSESESLE